MKALRWLATIAVVAAFSETVLAQTEGRVSGSVRDQSGAFVAGASVTVKNERTGDTRTAVSSERGTFLIAALKPSTYTIRVEKPGFSPLEYANMPLAAGQELPLDFEFKPAGVQESVTVTASSPVLDLSSAKIGVNVGEREVANLPLNGRQMSQLMLQAPGSENTASGTWYDVHFFGRAVEENAVRFDGVEGGSIIDSQPGVLDGETSTPFKLQASLENVQEFRVESGAYPAEFGTGSGGQVNVVTKSGSNAFHGSLFEYYRNDALDARNYFDYTRATDGTIQTTRPKSQLDQDQFGGSFGGPIVTDRAFFFGSYEGYRLNAGINLVQAVPSTSAWSRAVPAIAALRPGFLAPGAVILPGASANPDFDIAQLQSPQVVKENSFSGRFDWKYNNRWASYVRVFHDQGTSNQPDDVSGRVIQVVQNPTNAVFQLQGVLSDATTNEFKFGYNSAKSSIAGIAPVINGIDFSTLIFNLTGSVANNGIQGQGAASGIVNPGGLVRANSAQNGRAEPYDPYSLSFMDSLSSVHGNHLVKIGGEVRAIRLTTDRLGGTTYTFQNVTAFLANQPSSIQYLGDESAPSVFNNGATGQRHLKQQYFIGYAQDEWHVNPKFTLNYGVRYDYYTVLKEANDLEVKLNIDTGQIDPPTTPQYKSTPTNLQPRVSGTYAFTDKTVFKGGFGLYVGPGQTEDQIQPVADSDRISSTITSGSSLVFPLDPNVAINNFINNPNNRSYQPRAYSNDYEIPERIWTYTASIQQDLGHGMAATVGYLGSQGRNLFLRSITNEICGPVVPACANGVANGVITNPNPANAAIIIRQFSIPLRDASGNIIGVQNPYAEVDYKASGGQDSYNALELSFTRRSLSGLLLNANFTLGRSFGNSSGSNEALTAANNARTLGQFSYDNGYNSFAVRRLFNLSALYPIPYGRGRAHALNGTTDALLGGWDIGGIFNARSGLPIDVRITRPDVVYVDAAGNVFNNPAAGRTAISNTPGGGASRNVRRPDLIPGADPFIEAGGLLFLNPAAFATPAPGTFGNLERGLLHGPGFDQVDLMVSKHFPFTNSGVRNMEFRLEVFNLFNTANFTNPVATLPNALPSNSVTEANKVQPGQPFTTAAAGTFGALTSTVSRTVGQGTQRQIEFVVRLNF